MTKSKVYLHLFTVIKEKFGLGNNKTSYHHIFLTNTFKMMQTMIFTLPSLAAYTNISFIHSFIHLLIHSVVCLTTGR